MTALARSRPIFSRARRLSLEIGLPASARPARVGAAST